MKTVLAFILVAAALLAGCATPSPGPTATPTEQTVAATVTNVAPTEVPTAAPTHTPTSTPTATATPEPTTTPTSVPPTPTPTPIPPWDPGDYLVGAYYYGWYGHPGQWESGHTGTPSLGLYTSQSRDVIDTHLEWARESGIDFFLLSWWGPPGSEWPGDWCDSVVRRNFVENPSLPNIRFAILYETTGRFQGNLDIDHPANKATLLSDFDYLAQTYFSNPYYLRINDRPVIVIYASRIISGDEAGAVRDLREHIRANYGIELYLIGDEVYWEAYYDNFLQYGLTWEHFDAVTAYSMWTDTSLVQGGFPAFLEQVQIVYETWFRFAAEEGVDFIPNVMPGFDDRNLRPTRQENRVIHRSADGFREYVDLAKTYVDQDISMLLVTSFNEWGEGTNIEPSQAEGSAYLDIVRDNLP